MLGMDICSDYTGIIPALIGLTMYRPVLGTESWVSIQINSNSLLPGLRQIIEPIHGASQVGLMVKNSHASAGDMRDTGLIPVSGRSPGEGHGSTLQCSCLENSMDRGAWRATGHRVTKSQTWLKWLSPHAHAYSMGFLSDSESASNAGYIPALIWSLWEEGMATHSSISSSSGIIALGPRGHREARGQLQGERRK